VQDHPHQRHRRLRAEPSQFRPGSYPLTATYGGNKVYSQSASAKHKLTVTT